MVHVVMHRKWHARVGPVYRARGGEHQVPYLARPAPLKNVGEAHKVRVHVGLRVRERIPNPCLGGQVYDEIEILRLKKLANSLAIRQVHLYKTKRRHGCQLRQARPLQIHVVVVVEVVQPHHPVAFFQQALGDVKPDEACAAGNQNLLHRLSRSLKLRAASTTIILLGDRTEFNSFKRTRFLTVQIHVAQKRVDVVRTARRDRTIAQSVLEMSC